MRDAVLEGAATPHSKPPDNRIPPATGASSWLLPTGEMGEKIRAHDWGATPLGPLQSWPQSLRTLINLMLSSRQPVCVAWGTSLTLLYNDSFASILGPKHPAALGTPYWDVWPEMWNRHWSFIDSVMQVEGQHASDTPAVPDGQTDWSIGGITFAWTPVRDEAGRVAGFYCPEIERTGNNCTQVSPDGHGELAQRENAERYQALFKVLDQGFCIIELVFDERERPIDYIFIETNPAFEAQTGLDDAAGRSMRSLHLEHEGPWLEIYGRIALTGEPERFEHEAAGLGRWYDVFAYRIGEPKQRRIAILFDDITKRKRAEKARRESEERYRSFIAHSSEGIWLLEFDPPLDTSLSVEEQVRLAYRNGRFVDCNDAMARMYGLTRAEDLIGRTLEFTLPSADPEARAYLKEIISSGYSVTGVESAEQDAAGNRKHFDNSMIGIVENGLLKRLWGIQRDITERKKADEQRTLLINELNHRVKNTLATVQSIASQTLRNAETALGAKEALEARLIALARAHDVLTRESWEGAELKDIVTQALAPYTNLEESRLAIGGPEVRLSPRVALALSMALQELTTNAVKYGALSNGTGRVDVLWSVEPAEPWSRLHLRWQESGGPRVQVPTRLGFGSRLIERSLARELNGDVRVEFRPEGVLCKVDAPLS